MVHEAVDSQFVLDSVECHFVQLLLVHDLEGVDVPFVLDFMHPPECTHTQVLFDLLDIVQEVPVECVLSPVQVGLPLFL